MSLALNYNLRHILRKRTSLLLTMGGIALVVFVAVATLMLSAGLERTLASTGSARNVIALRTGAQNEIQSVIMRDASAIILADEAVARETDGTAAGSADVLVLVNLAKRSDGGKSNINMRGISKGVFLARPEIRIVAGRTPEFGTREIMVGSAVHKKFSGTDIGQFIRMVGIDWTVTGIFDAGNSGFSSEIWGDADILMPAFKREAYSSVTFRLREEADYPVLKGRLEGDPRLVVELRREQEYYASQSRDLARFIRILGIIISIVFSLGAVVGAAITMYSAVAGRTREIGILRAIGFSRFTVFIAFLKESLIIAFAGGCLGLLLSSILCFFAVSTTNFQSFSELAFQFHITPIIALQGLLFALLMGLIGGALPAWRAARTRILEAIRTE